jgi:hypothetical protein
MSVRMIGLDTAKSIFQIHGVNEAGMAELKRKLRRSELIPFPVVNSTAQAIPFRVVCPEPARQIGA